MKFWACVKYLALISMAGFIFGRFLPKQIMKWDKVPYKNWRFEKGGKIYQGLKISAWQGKLPDMSKIFTKIMPKKGMPARLTEENITVMLQETCIAELIHILLCLAGLYCVVLWPDTGGGMVAALYALGNLPFIMAQRYNRPKLHKILKHMQRNSFSAEGNSEECELCEC